MTKYKVKINFCGQIVDEVEADSENEAIELVAKDYPDFSIENSEAEVLS